MITGQMPRKPSCAAALVALGFVVLLPPIRAGADASAIRFTALPEAAGIDLVMTSGGMPSREILEVNGGGIALFDFDNDGDLDVFLANGATLAAPNEGPGSRLYANRGDGRFEDVTRRVGLDLRRWAMGVAVGDVDGDGWDDLFVTHYGSNVLLRNAAGEAGTRRFVEIERETFSATRTEAPWSTSAAFGDLDGDGDLDLYVNRYLSIDARNPPSRIGKAYKGIRVMAGPIGLAAQADALYENLGSGRFRDVTTASGLAVDPGADYGLGVRIADFDGDGKQDIFVGNDSTADRLWQNRGGMTFRDHGVIAGVSANGVGTTQASMGIGLVDADSNGFPDLFVTVFSDDTNTLHLNLGDGFFDDRSAQLGLAAVSQPYLGWGCGFFDFDLDGDEDLFIANGHVYPEMDDPQVGSSWAQRPLLFERRGRRFVAVPCDQPWCQASYHGRATAFGDIDGDRDVDILMTTLNGPVVVLRNDTPASGRALTVRLDSPPPNRHGYGSVVEVETAAGVQRRWITGGGSYQSVDAPEAYFGLGAIEASTSLPGNESNEAASAAPGRERSAADEADSTPLLSQPIVRVRWPDGTVTTSTNEPIDGLLIIKPPEARTERRP